MTDSMAGLGQMQDVRVASMKVRTAEERRRFSDMWPSYMNRGGRSTVDWDRMAVDWNADVEKMVAGGNAIKPIFRKTVGHLQQHWRR